MAGTAPERAARRTAYLPLLRATSRPRAWQAGWLPPLLLALAVVIAVMAAYSVRPHVRIDLGDYDDLAYLNLDQFNGREVGAVAPPVAIAWPPDQNVLTLPGRRAGLWMATIYAADNQPDRALRGITLTANGTYLSIIHPTITDPKTGAVSEDPRRFLAIIPPEVAAADTITLELVPALRGNPSPPAGLVGRVEVAPAQTYRWSEGESTLMLPGLGRGAWLVTFTALVRHPDNRPLDAAIAANGVTIARLPEGATLRRFSVAVPASLMGSGDLALRISSQTYHDPRPLGVQIQEVGAAPLGRGALLPPPGSLVYGMIVALGMYFCLLRMTWSRLVAGLAALAVLLAGAWLLATARYPTVFMLPRLAALMAWSGVLLLGLERIVAWGFRRAGVPLGPRLLRGLLLIFFIGYWIKAGGMLYPYFVGLDIGWHMDRVRDILNGRLPEFYGINSPLNENTMPAAEWGENPPVIPYSPWFHMFATSFALLPLPLTLTANMFSALVDGSRVFLIALLGRKGGLNGRQALLAALLYAVTPVTFLLHSWANVPTTFGMWWTLLGTVCIVIAYRRLDRRGPFAILTLLLTATLLMYTVMAAFMLLFLALLVPALWLTTPRGERRPVAALGLAGVLALGIAILVYYGQYIAPVIERSIPYFTQAAAGGERATGVRYDPFGLYLVKYWWRMSYFDLRTNAYGLQLVLPLGLLGMFAVRSRRLRVVFGCWLAVALAFLVVGNRVSMVDKHLFYLVPALAVGVGLVLGRLWRRGRVARLVVIGVYAMTFAAALNLWLHRIVTVQQ